MKYVASFLALPIGLTALFFAVSPAQAQQVKVPIEFHRQEHSLSCEVATLKIALKTHGIEVSEAELIKKLPFDPTPKQPGVWGDPNKGFVGSIDGKMLITGYGVYWDPIAALGATYATTQVIHHGSTAELAKHIAAGNPVIIWGYYGTRRAYSWRTPGNTPVTAINGEHTMVVYGFDGPATAPTRLYVMDPVKGAFSWSPAELMHNWSALGHMGVVVSATPRWVRLPDKNEVWELSTDNKTRQHITSWGAFLRRGGSGNDIHSMSNEKLRTYTIGSPIN